MSEEIIPQESLASNSEPTKRPTFLTVLCILTFIGSGLSLISNLFWVLFYEPLMDVLSQNPNEMFQEVYNSLLTTSRWLFFVDLMLCISSVFGAIFMYKLKRIGFHLYTVSNILLVLTPVFFTEDQGINFLGLIFISVPFIILYGLHYKHLK